MYYSCMSTRTISNYNKSSIFFFFNDTATTEIYTLSLHDALPISDRQTVRDRLHIITLYYDLGTGDVQKAIQSYKQRSEEHTSELQSQSNLVCRLLLEKKNTALPGELDPSATVLAGACPGRDLP